MGTRYRYIGSKFKLIDYILDTVREYCGEDLSEKSFCDLFAGTGIVGKSFSPFVKKVVANDLEYYSFVANHCNLRGFNKENVTAIINHLNEMEGAYEGVLYDAYAEGGKCGRLYFSKENGAKIQAAREYIESIKDEIPNEDYLAVIFSIASAADKIANTASTYGAYLKEFKAQSLKPIEFEVPDCAEGDLSNNQVFLGDANEIIKLIKDGDILYLDPPYNTRQYSAYYHVLNGIANFDVPESDSKTGVAKGAYNKSAYSIEKTALSQLDDLLNNSDFEWIFMSYNNEGIISAEDIKATFEKYGTYYLEEQEYQRYKADSKRDYTADKTVEYIHVLHKGHFNETRENVKTEPEIVITRPAPVIKSNDEPFQLCLFSDEEMSEMLVDGLKETGDIIVSPMNYTGGKKKLMARLKELFPKRVNTFVDLFCGGCTVGINAEAGQVIFNDSIEPMIDMYRAFKSHTSSYVQKYVERQIKKYNLSLTNEAGYMKLRDDYNKHRKPLDLFVLTAYGFNHMIRFNGSGEYNIPFGKDRSQYNNSIKKNLGIFINEFRRRSVEFMSVDFRDYPFETLKPGDMVYCDPPYFVSTAAYNATWGEKEERDLLAILDRLNERGIKFALSNVIENKGETNTILKEWAEANNYNVHHLDMSYANSSYHRKERDDISDEVLITNY